MSFIFPLAMITVFFLSWFFYLFFRRPHSLWLGLSFTVSFFFVILTLVLILFTVLGTEGLFMRFVAPFAFIFLLFLILLFSLLLFIVPITSGIRLIKREGFSLSHTLSVAFGIFYFSYLVIAPILVNKSPLASNLYSFSSAIVFYFAFLLFLYTLSSLLNIFPHHKKNYDYILVLGSGLIEGRVPPLLGSRMDKALAYGKKHQSTSTYVFSGGKGVDETRPEGEAMEEYALNKGLPQSHIIAETLSTSTKENIQFSYSLMMNHYQENKGKGEPSVLVVTSRYHVFRALLLAKKQGHRWEGLGAKTKFYYSLNGFLREFIAYVTITKKIHLFFCILIVINALFFSQHMQSFIFSFLQK